MALMISDVIGQVAQLELMAKYGIKPNTEFCAAIHEKYYKEATSPEKLEAQVAVNTQRDIDMEETKKPIITTWKPDPYYEKHIKEAQKANDLLQGKLEIKVFEKHETERQKQEEPKQNIWKRIFKTTDKKPE